MDRGTEFLKKTHDSLVDTENHSRTSTDDSDDIWTKVFSRIRINDPPKLQVRNRVRNLKHRSTFGKGYPFNVA